MIRRVVPALTGVALLLALIHLGLSAFAWRDWNANALWFAGSGLAILLAGLINIVMLRAGAVDGTQRAVWALANLAMTAFFGLAWTVLKAPQVIAGGVVFALLCVGALRARDARSAHV